MAKVIEHVNAHYEVQDVPMGKKVYRWCPENVLVECEECGENTTLTASTRACGECGADHRAIVEEVGLEARPEEDEVEPPMAFTAPLLRADQGCLEEAREGDEERAKKGIGACC